MGTGPFTFVEYVADQYILVENNPNYFLGAPILSQVYIRLSAQATQLAQLESGELHVMQAIDAREAERLSTSDVVNIVPTPGVGLFQTAVFNERFPDKRVRQAFMYGVDRQAIMDVVLQGQGRLSSGDRVFVTTGDHSGLVGGTNTLKLLRVGAEGTPEGMGDL